VKKGAKRTQARGGRETRTLSKLQKSHNRPDRGKRPGTKDRGQIQELALLNSTGEEVLRGRGTKGEIKGRGAPSRASQSECEKKRKQEKEFARRSGKTKRTKEKAQNAHRALTREL